LKEHQGWSRRRKIAVALAVAALALLLSARPILRAIPRALVHDDGERTADAIVVLAGDGGERVERTAELWKKGLARTGLVFVSGGPIYHRTTWASLMAAHLEELGVPRDKIVRQELSRTTGEDAAETVKLLDAHGVRSILLVTSAWHSARARRRFVEVCGDKTEVVSCPVREPELEGGWWNDPVAARAVATEVLKWLWPGKG
jgi:uncharacterized SAM-binding protein YcdF (DUF218 family)